ncbi:MAG: metallophosphoesterase family protein [Clostridia bacterium]|nr:metallophosphoesterase family protein [Clostridia bacterium]
MILAVIADVHSNVFALQAAIEELKKYSPDKFVFLGDIVGVGAFPEETVRLARKVENAVFVRGNHDLMAYSGESPYKKDDVRGKMTAWQFKALSKASKAFLSEFPEVVSFDAEGKKVVCMHYPKSSNGWFKIPKLFPSENEIKEIFDGVSGDVVLFGHEHSGSFHEIDGRHFINFGTCGNFLSPNAARCGIVEISAEKVVYKSINAYYDDRYARERREEILNILSKI